MEDILSSIRPDGRKNNQLREIKFEPGIAPHASGSVLVSFGNTKVICAANIEEKVPGWMMRQKVEGGWLSAEYSLLPYSTLERKQREVSRGKQEGRTIEIQRLIGRSLRCAIDLKKFKQRTLWIDCDVLQADGGTRTASITGAYVASVIAINKLLAEGKLDESPILDSVAAVSVGIYKEDVILDLNYLEDKEAFVDFNVVMTGSGQFIEVQGTGEESTFSPAQLNAMVELAGDGIKTLTQLQNDAIAKLC
jgi:ribonuclease PH